MCRTHHQAALPPQHRLSNSRRRGSSSSSCRPASSHISSSMMTCRQSSSGVVGAWVSSLVLAAANRGQKEQQQQPAEVCKTASVVLGDGCASVSCIPSLFVCLCCPVLVLPSVAVSLSCIPICWVSRAMLWQPKQVLWTRCLCVDQHGKAREAAVCVCCTMSQQSTAECVGIAVISQSRCTQLNGAMHAGHTTHWTAASTALNTQHIRKHTSILPCWVCSGKQIPTAACRQTMPSILPSWVCSGKHIPTAACRQNPRSENLGGKRP